MPVSEHFYRVILEALPVPVFLVDQEMHIHALNRAAAKLCGDSPETILLRRSGEALRCLHAGNLCDGCGLDADCADCVIRDSVGSSFAGKSIHRRRVKLQSVKLADIREIELLVTVVPLSPDESQLSLMVLEDMTETTLLKSLIPICMHCKNVRDDAQYWQRVDRYFHRFAGVDFTHGLCPDCQREHYPETCGDRAAGPAGEAGAETSR